jgi:hypothetical protein
MGQVRYNVPFPRRILTPTIMDAAARKRVAKLLKDAEREHAEAQLELAEFDNDTAKKRQKLKEKVMLLYSRLSALIGASTCEEE